MALDISRPRRVNGQVVILRNGAGDGGRLEVLLQLRSKYMQVMPGHLGAIGGCRSSVDPDSRATALREVQEETGLAGGIALPPAKFAEGEKCDWYVMKLSGATFAPAETKQECDDIRSVMSLLPTSTTVADCFGHAWVPVDDLSQIQTSGLPLMGGLFNRVDGAVKHLGLLEAQLPQNVLGSQDATALLQGSRIEISLDGELVSCPREGHGAAPAGAVASPGALRTQLEYYLSDDNLRYDKFFQDKIRENGGWLDMCWIMGCRKIQAMKATEADVAAVLQASETVEVREDSLAIRRRGNLPLPDLVPPKGKGRGKGYGKGFGKGKSW